jgi:hypothetical protein
VPAVSATTVDKKGERESGQKKQAAGSWLNLLASQILQPAT